MLRSRILEPFGVSVEAKLSDGLGSTEVSQLKQLFGEHDLLIVSGQTLSPEDQVRVMGYIGRVLEIEPGRGHEYISTLLGPAAGLGTIELSWHSDMGFSPAPFDAISLHAVDVVDGASATKFVSNVGGYRRLSETTQARIGGAKALHVYASDLGGRMSATQLTEGVPSAVHPLVWHHPVTGAPFVFASWLHTHSVVGLEPAEGDALLDELFAQLYDPASVFTHAWARGDVVIWNNQTVQHARSDVGLAGARVLQRVVTGKNTFGELYPELARPI
jgi:taurine dioxygenase